MSPDFFKLVRDGYRKMAGDYHQSKTNQQGKVKILHSWLDHDCNNGRILELGCGSGYPVGEVIIRKHPDYLGLDLSEEMISLARENYPQWAVKFVAVEMLSFCRKEKDNSYTGVASILSIRHIPRIHHVELFSQIYRILTPGGLYLMTCASDATDGVGTWYGGKEMYWSGFSEQWTRLTLQELGFVLIEEQADSYDFDGIPVDTLYLMLQKPK